MGAKKDDDYVPHHPAGANVQIGYGLSSVELTFTTVDDDLVEGTEIFAIGLYPSSKEGMDFSYGTRMAIATIRMTRTVARRTRTQSQAIPPPTRPSAQAVPSPTG